MRHESTFMLLIGIIRRKKNTVKSEILDFTFTYKFDKFTDRQIKLSAWLKCSHFTCDCSTKETAQETEVELTRFNQQFEVKI